MFRNSTIFTRVFLSHIAVGFGSVVALSLVFYFLFQNALNQRTLDQLSSINILKKNQIEQYFHAVQRNLEFQLASASKPGSGDNVLIPLDAGFIEQIKQVYDFASLQQVDEDFNAIGPVSADSLLGDLIQAVARRRQQSITAFEIVETGSYLPTLTTDIVYLLPLQSGAKSEILFVRDKFEKIQAILQETTGMGNTGESYLVGSDYKMRSLSRFFPERPPRSILVNTVAARFAFQGTHRGEVILDYRGERVLSFFRKVDTPSLNWALISEINYDEAMQPLDHWRNSILAGAVIILVLIFIVTFFIAESIAKPILYLKEIISTLSRGILPTMDADMTAKGEVGQITRAIRDLIDGLKRTAEFADEIGAGNFNADFITLSNKDTLGLALLQMRDRLRNLSSEQIRLVREKAAALLEGQENERKRVVLELHDGVGQLLTAIRLQLEMIARGGSLGNGIMSLVNETIDEVKRISYDLMPNAIVDFGLEAALKGLCDRVSRSAPVEVDFQYVKEFDHTLRFEISIGVFRILQEGFNNILKHAGASRIELHVLDKEHELYFLLRDNGRGFTEATANAEGFGLRSMKERAKLLAGSLEIHSVPGSGTEIEVTIPTRDPQHAKN